MLRYYIFFIFIFILLGQSAYSVFDSALFPEPGWGVSKGCTAWGDYNNDGYLDLAIAGSDDTENYNFRIYKNDGTGNLSTYIEPQPGWGLGSKCYLAWCDYDNDGDQDIAVLGRSNPVPSYTCKIFRNNGNGTFDTNAVWPKANWGALSGHLAWGDLNNDGYPDLVVSGNSVIYIFINDGQGGFKDNGTFLNTDENYRIVVALGDYNNDHFLDLAVNGAIEGAYSLRIYKNNGDATFTAYVEPGPGTYHSSISWADFNNDGYLDLTITGIQGMIWGVGLIYINNGNNTFDSYNGPGLYNGLYCWGDTDNDGDLDVGVIGYSVFNNVTNNGDSTFSGYEKIDPGWIALENAYGCWGDIDNDGDLDLGACGYNMISYSFRLYKNLVPVTNTHPQTPVPLDAVNIDGFWHFKWKAPKDDHTPVKLLRYNIAIRSKNSLNYNYGSTNIFLAQGQANIGNVPISGKTCYQSRIPVSTNVYWKVCAIDTAFKHSAYCQEQSAVYTYSEPVTEEFRLHPNYLTGLDNDKVYIYLSNLDEAEKEYHLFIATINGQIITDLGIKSYRELNQGVLWKVMEDPDKSLASGVYLVISAGQKARYIKKFYFKK